MKNISHIKLDREIVTLIFAKEFRKLTDAEESRLKNLLIEQNRRDMIEVKNIVLNQKEIL